MHKQFIRNKKNRPIGVLLAKLTDGKLQLGWSLHTNPKDYNAETGFDVAKARLQLSRSFLKSGKPSTVYKGIIPHSAKEQADQFIKYVRNLEKKRIGA